MEDDAGLGNGGLGRLAGMEPRQVVWNWDTVYSRYMRHVVWNRDTWYIDIGLVPGSASVSITLSI